MIQWLSQQKKMHSFQNYIAWKKEQDAGASNHLESLSHNVNSKVLSLPKYPTQPQQLVTLIEKWHSAPGFSSALKSYLNLLSSHLTSAQVASMHPLPFQRVDIYHTFKFHPPSLEDDEKVCDVIKAAPPAKKRPSQFDNAVVLHTDNAESTGLAGAFDDFIFVHIINTLSGTRIGRVHVVFKLLEEMDYRLGPTPMSWTNTPLVYIEWYTGLKPTAEPIYNMYSIKKLYCSDGT
jgi:hypothetical protein